jgi:hypothetical protein
MTRINDTSKTISSCSCPSLSVGDSGPVCFAAPHGVVTGGGVLVAVGRVAAVGTLVTWVNIVAVCPTVIVVGITFPSGSIVLVVVVVVVLIVVLLVVLVVVVIVVIVVAATASVIASVVVVVRAVAHAGLELLDLATKLDEFSILHGELL